MYRELSSVYYLAISQRHLHTDPQCLEYLVSPAVHVTRIPSQLEPDVAAPLLCGM